MKNKNLLFVTGNKNKLKEAQLFIPNYTIESAWVDVEEIQSVDVYEVAAAKLVSAFQQTNQSCFVMDASLVIEWLCKQDSENKSFPWALIKDVFTHMWDKNITELVKTTQNFTCTWTAVIWYFDWNTQHFFSESVNGNISENPKWDNWYDWDTIFIPHWETKTFAEMSFEEKQSFALTGKLYKQLWDFLNAGM